MNTAFTQKYVEGSTDGQNRKCNLVAINSSPEKAVPLTQLLFAGSPFKVPARPKPQLVADSSQDEVCV